MKEEFKTDEKTDLLNKIVNSDSEESIETLTKELFISINNAETQASFLNQLENTKKQKFEELSKKLNNTGVLNIWIALSNLCIQNEPAALFILKNIQTNQKFFDMFQKLKSIENNPELEIKSRRIILMMLVNIINSVKNLKGDPKKFSPIILFCLNFYFSPDINQDLYKAEIKQLELLDEWVYYFFFNAFKHSSQELTFSSISSILDPENFKNSFSKSNYKVVQFWKYIFSLIQKTVEQKIHFSIIREFDVKTLENDKFYHTGKVKDGVGLQLNLKDFQFIKEIFLINTKESLNIYDSSMSDRLFVIHAMIRMMIPITYLGGYNHETQKLFFPEILGNLGKFIEHLNRNIYRKKIEIEKDASYELNTNILRLAGNIVHTYTEAQDFLVDNGLVIPFLNFTMFDENNPLCKEATIVFIRYVTDSNDRARAAIASLKVMDLESETSKITQKMSFI